jgi:DNA-binding IclR family transcriptional regulator
MEIETGCRTLKTPGVTLEILELLKELDGARVTELSEEIDRVAGTVHAHLATLRERGYVIKEGDEYHLSNKFLEFGTYVQTRKDEYNIAKSYTEQIATETDRRAVFAVEENGLGVYIHVSSGDHAVWKFSYPGKQFYLHQTAVGKALLSELPRDTVEGIVEHRGLPARTENTITDQEELVVELETIREQGYSVNREEQVEGIAAVGVPVTGKYDSVLGAFSVAAPVNRQGDEWEKEEFVSVLFRVADEFELEHSLA